MHTITYLCRPHIRLHNRPHPCRTHKIIPVRTSPRACRTLCGNSAPLSRLHRPGNSRSHPGPSECTAACRRTAPRCICRGSSPRTWHLRPMPQRLAQEVRTAPRWGGETWLDAGRLESSSRWADSGSEREKRTTSGRLEWSDLRFIRLDGYQQWTTLFCTWLALVNFLIPVLSSFFVSQTPFFRDPAWKRDLLLDRHPGIEIRATWCHKLSLVCFFVCQSVTEPPNPLVQ